MPSLTEQLFGSSSGSAAALAFTEQKKTDLDLYAVAPQVKKESRRDKRRRLEEEAKGVKKGPTTHDNVLDNILLLAAPEDDESKRHVKQKHLRHAINRDEEEDKRTVFVGNLPNDVDKKVVQKAFRDCGEIASIRIRNQVLEEEQDKKRGRAVRVLRGDIKKGDQYSASAFILFEKASSTKLALEKSGLVVAARHIFVTRVDEESKSFPPQTSIFLGNLAYDTSEEDVWMFFVNNGVGDVRRVRLVRDKESGEGKGFGYVEFMKPDSVQRAIDTRGAPLHGREVRICHVTKDKKVANLKSTRRDQRKTDMKKAVKSGPLKRGEGAQVKSDVADFEHKPSWMGTTTNPRKKLARDLRPLVTDSAPRKKRDAHKTRAPLVKKRPPGPSK